MRNATDSYSPHVRVVTLMALLLTPLAAPAQDWAWAAGGHGAGVDVSHAVAVDADGNAYVAGFFGFPGGVPVTFDPFTLNSAGDDDVFLVKYAPDGEVLWARSDGGAGSDAATGIAVDVEGNVYVTGGFGLLDSGPATFGDTTLTSAGSYDAFLVKYSPDGEVLWARRDGGTGRDGGDRVTLDTDGNAFVTGSFEGTATFGSLTLTSASGWDVFVAKYSAEGEVLWARSGSGPDGDEGGQSVGVDAAGNAYITGRFEGALTFDPITLTNPGTFCNAFLVKYSPEGDVLWARNDGGTGLACASGMTVEEDGDVYVTGRFALGATFGPFTLPGGAGNDVFLVKYSPDGEVLWARGDGGPGYDEGHALEIDASGDVYATGYFYETADFGPFTLTAADDDWDVFLVRYSPEGDVLSAWSGGGLLADNAYDLSIDADGDIYVVGHFEGSATFGETTLFNFARWDVFVAKHEAAVVAVEPGAEPAGAFALSEAAPNPSGGTARLTLALGEGQRVTAAVYDALGRRVAVLHDGPLASGAEHMLVFEGGTLPPGLYVVRVTGEWFKAVRRIALVR